MARRRKKAAWQVIPLWTGALVLVGWGVWQAREFRRNLLAEVQEKGAVDPSVDAAQGEVVTTQPVLAVAAESVSRQPPVERRGAIIPVSRSNDVDDPLRNDSVMLSIPRGVGGMPETPPPTLQIVEEGQTAAELVARGTRLLEVSRIVEGRAALNAALARTTDESLAASLRGTLAELNGSVFLGSAIVPDDPLAHYVEIRSGDSFLRIGHEYGLTGDFVQRLNPGLNPRNLKPAAGVKIVEGPFRVRLSKQASRIDLYALDMYVSSMTVQFPEGNFLPSGDYRISPGTKLQLGGRTWIGFEGAEMATEAVTAGWIYGGAGPRGSSKQDRIAGVRLGESDLQVLYNVLVETRSQVRVDP